jgi:hypothetical protein
MRKNILDKEKKELALKYVLLSLLSYGFVFVGIILFIEVIGVSKNISFAVIYGINYLCLYTAQNKYLFKTKHNNSKLIRFVIYLVVFYFLAIFLFTIGTKIGLQYLVATGTTIIILFPLRLLILKKVVYKD